MARKSIKVKPESRGWAVVHSGTTQPVGLYRTKEEATRTAQKIAREQNLDLVIQAGFGRYRTARGVNTHVLRGGAKGINPTVKMSAAAQPQERESEAQRKARLWREWAGSHNTDSPNLSDDAVSRESIYGDRG